MPPEPFGRNSSDPRYVPSPARLRGAGPVAVSGAANVPTDLPVDWLTIFKDPLASGTTSYVRLGSNALAPTFVAPANAGDPLPSNTRTVCAGFVWPIAVPV